MPTTIYGHSDDLIEFEGDVRGEVGFYGSSDEQDSSALVVCSDGTILTVKYGKADQGIWCLTLIQQGSLYQEIVPCFSEDADPYSDIAYFRDGLKWAYVATKYQRVK